MRWKDPEDARELELALSRFLREVAGGEILEAEEEFATDGGGYLPSVDMVQTPKGIRVVAELPGVAPDSLALLAGDGALVIKGEWGGAIPRTSGTPIIVETRKGPFSRKIHLPVTIDGEKASAILENGVLTVELPFKKARKARKAKAKVPAGEV